jgi:hypothetical protein
MIFIAGISPKTKTLDQNPRWCSICGLHQAYERRVDHYLSLFFIPVLRVKKGEPFILCDRCEGISPEYGSGFRSAPENNQPQCRHCGKPLNSDFKYCPYCSKRV